VKGRRHSFRAIVFFARRFPLFFFALQREEVVEERPFRAVKVNV
jgi:hypothetical protein